MLVNFIFILEMDNSVGVNFLSINVSEYGCYFFSLTQTVLGGTNEFGNFEKINKMGKVTANVLEIKLARR